MYFKMNIDGEIYYWIEKVIKCWLYENVLKIVKIEFDLFFWDINDRY